MEFDSGNLQRAEAQFRGTQASTMEPMTIGPTHMIVLIIYARGATTAPLPGCWCSNGVSTTPRVVRPPTTVVRRRSRELRIPGVGSIGFNRDH